MSAPRPWSRPAAQAARTGGFVLVAGMLLLLVLTVLALGMFRSVGLDGLIGGNIRDKQRAVQAAESAEQYAEWWLTSSNNSVYNVITCTQLVNANQGQGQVCTNPLNTVVANVASVPWMANGAPIGTTYTPAGMTVAAGGGMGNYFAVPTFYVSLLGPAPGGVGTIYQIDAVGYGGSPESVSVVETTFQVSPGIQDLTQQ